MSPFRALVPASAASALWYTFLTVVGATVGRNWNTVKGLLDRANYVLAIVAIVATIALGLYVRWLMKSRRGRA